MIQTSRAKMHVAMLVLSLVALGLVTGCADPAMQAQFEQMVTTARQLEAARGVESGNRLLVQGTDGNLYTVRPDGTDRLAITTDASPRRQYLQPTWSPSGEQVAYATVDSSNGAAQSALVVSRFNGLATRRYPTPFAPFYIHWSPDEARLAYLSNWRGLNEQTIALRLLDLQEQAGEITTLAEGQPLYFSWSPDGTRLLAHIGNERLEFRAVNGESQALTLTAAGFPAPQWSGDGTRLIYALGDETGRRLVMTDPDGSALTELTTYRETIAFGLSPDGARVAYIITPRGVGTAAFGALYVVDANGGRTVEITDVPVFAFFWSPNGENLAYLTLDNSAGTLQLRWNVWDGQRTRAYATMVPSRTFLQGYLAFFDQYTRSMTPWSPDSSAFAYAAVEPSRGPGIYVQRLEDDAPVRVGQGVYVAWSPR